MTLWKEIAQSLVLIALLAVTSAGVLGAGLLFGRMVG